MRISRLFLLFILTAMVGCYTADPEPKIEYYEAGFRKNAPPPVYSRMMWSHLPQPIPLKAEQETPLLMPKISFELPHSNLREAMEAMAQTLGYRAKYPAASAKLPVSLKESGNVETILQRIEQQTKVRIVLDHEQRVIRVLDYDTVPRLLENEQQQRY